MKIEVSQRPSERATCVYCRGEVEAREALALCPACGCTLHDECRGQLQRCPTPGCAGLERPVRRQATRPGRRQPVPSRTRLPPARTVVHASRPDAPGDVARAETFTDALGWALVGGGLGLLLGILLCLPGKRSPGLPPAVALPPAIVGLALQGLLSGLVGVRREPLLEAYWSNGKKQEPASLVTALLTLGGAFGGWWLLGSLVPTPWAPIAGAIVALTLSLRWIGCFEL